jgi:hypothetical protein
MVLRNIENIWDHIASLEAAEFHTKTGRPFTFTVSGDVLQVSRTEYNLSKANFAKALEIAPVDGPGTIRNIVRGPPYVWALLHEARVRNSKW